MAERAYVDPLCKELQKDFDDLKAQVVAAQDREASDGYTTITPHESSITGFSNSVSGLEIGEGLADIGFSVFTNGISGSDIGLTLSAGEGKVFKSNQILVGTKIGIEFNS
jgi:hypothetical protein